jgi:demethylmenaquinone methyltransferase/2-methoxy-6-polyprenyl-1,4-benzoquinol methylase
MVLSRTEPMRRAERSAPSALRRHAAPEEPRADGSGAMFDRIAVRYDLLNRLLSLGLDRRWRRRLIAAADLRPGARVLDLATGTGDVALALRHRHPEVEVVGLDPSRGMLERARAKERRAPGGPCRWYEGVAEELPFGSGSFDAVTMAFGIRNVTSRERALGEIARVLRPGGRLAILELAEPRAGWLGAVSRLWVRQVVPRLGALLGSPAAYRYLQRSMAAFPAAPEFARSLSAAGLEVIEVASLGLGACTLFVARRPAAGRVDGGRAQ